MAVTDLFGEFGSEEHPKYDHVEEDESE